MLFYNKNNSKHKEDYMKILKVMDMFIVLIMNYEYLMHKNLNIG